MSAIALLDQEDIIALAHVTATLPNVMEEKARRYAAEMGATRGNLTVSSTRSYLGVGKRSSSSSVDEPPAIC